MIKLTFNKLGILHKTEVDPIRQGDSGVELVVIFEEKQNFNYTARFNLTRNDGTKITDVLLDPSSTNLNEYSRKLDNAWFFAINGTATLTAFIVDSKGDQIASGQATLNVEKTDFDENPPITLEQYLDLLARFSQKADKSKTILTVKLASDIGTDLRIYDVNQIFYVYGSLQEGNQDGKRFLRYNGTTLEEAGNLTKIFENAIAYTDEKVEELENNINQKLEDEYDTSSQVNVKVGMAKDDAISSANTYTDVEIQNVKNQLGAHKLSSDEFGNNFETEQELKSASVYYWRGQPHTPDVNDFAIVNKYGSDPNNLLPARFSFDGEDWTFDFILTELTKAQQKALNSGIDVDKVAQIGTNKANIEALQTEVAGKSSVSVSNEEVSGAEVAKSIKVDGTDYNLGGGSGTVKSVNLQEPDENGKVVLTAEDIALDETENITVKNKIVEQDEKIVALGLRVAGKQYGIVISYNEQPIAEDYFEAGVITRPDGTQITTWEEYQSIVSGKQLLNPIFNSSADTLIDETYGGYYILVRTNFNIPNNFILVTAADLKAGDDIYIVEKKLSDGTTDCPDRYCGNPVSFLAAQYKVDLSTYATKDEVEQTYATKIELNAKANLVDGKVPSDELPVATNSKLGTIKGYTGYGYYIDTSGNLSAINLAYNSYKSVTPLYFISKGTLENVLNEDPRIKRPLELISTTTPSGYFSFDKDYKITVNPTSINMGDFDGTGDHTSIYFIAGSNLSVTLPNGAVWVDGTPNFVEGNTYKIIVEKGVADNTYDVYLIRGRN